MIHAFPVTAAGQRVTLITDTVRPSFYNLAEAPTRVLVRRVLITYYFVYSEKKKSATSRTDVCAER